jgi:hypothetical protein
MSYVQGSGVRAVGGAAVAGSLGPGVGQIAAKSTTSKLPTRRSPATVTRIVPRLAPVRRLPSDRKDRSSPQWEAARLSQRAGVALRAVLDKPE